MPFSVVCRTTFPGQLARGGGASVVLEVTTVLLERTVVVEPDPELELELELVVVPDFVVVVSVVARPPAAKPMRTATITAIPAAELPLPSPSAMTLPLPELRRMLRFECGRLTVMRQRLTRLRSFSRTP
jgi:hypothetical protein